PEAIRLLTREGHPAHAAGAPRRQGGRVGGDAREGRGRRRPTPRARAVGDDGAPVVSPSFNRRGEAVVVTLESNEVELLRTIPDEVRSALAEPVSKDDPVHNRLFPSAYLDPTEERAEQER